MTSPIIGGLPLSGIAAQTAALEDTILNGDAGHGRGLPAPDRKPDRILAAPIIDEVQIGEMFSRVRSALDEFSWAQIGEGSGVLRRTPHSLKDISQPVSRVLEGTACLWQAIRDGHSSGTTFARCLEQPTRTASLTSPCGVIACANDPRCHPYSVLLPVWFAMPVPLPDPRCALTAPFHPCCLRGGSGSFSVALSLGSPPPDVIRHRMSMEPGLSSPAAFRP